MKIAVFCDVMRCSLMYGDVLLLHFRVENEIECGHNSTALRKPSIKTGSPSRAVGVKRTLEEYGVLKGSIYIGPYLFTLKMEATHYFETTVIDETTRFHIPEDSNLHVIFFRFDAGETIQSTFGTCPSTRHNLCNRQEGRK